MLSTCRVLPKTSRAISLSLGATELVLSGVVLRVRVLRDDVAFVLTLQAARVGAAGDDAVP